jgi:hypothetical protein
VLAESSERDPGPLPKKRARWGGGWFVRAATDPGSRGHDFLYYQSDRNRRRIIDRATLNLIGVRTCSRLLGVVWTGRITVSDPRLKGFRRFIICPHIPFGDAYYLLSPGAFPKIRPDAALPPRTIHAPVGSQPYPRKGRG